MASSELGSKNMGTIAADSESIFLEFSLDNMKSVKESARVYMAARNMAESYLQSLIRIDRFTTTKAAEEFTAIAAQAKTDELEAAFNLGKTATPDSRKQLFGKEILGYQIRVFPVRPYVEMVFSVRDKPKKEVIPVVTGNGTAKEEE